MARSTDVKLAPRPAQRAIKPAVPRQWPAPIEPAVGYLREVWVELNWVDWPTRRELVSSTIVVVIVLLAMSIYLGFFDYVYTVLVKQFLLKQPLR
jgi:preprotein translocase subunit SecE